MLDFFYEVLPTDKKLRLHYYQFMQEVHGSLKKIAQQKNPLKIIAKDLADRVRVLFLDEFFCIRHHRCHDSLSLACRFI